LVDETAQLLFTWLKTNAARNRIQ